MSIKGRDKEFRIPKVSYLDFKHIEMDRVLTMLFPRLKYEGYASRRPPRGGDLSVDEFLEDFLEHPEWFAGFDKHPDITRAWIETDLTRPYMQDQKTVDAGLRQIPLRRFGKPEDIGPLAVYLASDEATFVTGQAFVIDGGQIAH